MAMSLELFSKMVRDFLLSYLPAIYLYPPFMGA